MLDEIIINLFNLLTLRNSAHVTTLGNISVGNICNAGIHPNDVIIAE